MIRDATGDADVAVVRRLFAAYAASLDVDLCFQNFTQELADLPGDYAPPGGCLLLAEANGYAQGCVALRPLAAADATAAGIGEVKRLYVEPRARGAGVGRVLMHALLDRARRAGYRELKLDTLATMATARMLYASLGFRECAAYYRNPLPGTLYMALRLDRAPSG